VPDPPTTDPTLKPAVGDGSTEDVGEAGPAATTTVPPTSTVDEPDTTPSTAEESAPSTTGANTSATASGEAETTTVLDATADGEAELAGSEVPQGIAGSAVAITSVLGAVEVNFDNGTFQLRIASDTARTALVWAIWVASTLVIMALWLPLPVRLGQIGNSVPRRR
jgi:hypothetical protein